MIVHIPIATRPAYEVVVGRGLLSHAEGATTGASAVVVVTDENVDRLYGEALGALARAPRIVLPAGETTKSFERLEGLLERLAELELDRRSCLLALGGGVVGDLAGLAAALYMRGVALVQCPTTLVAQVDSSVGGKTAINLSRGKNLAGTFHQPHVVLADVDTLASLPEEEFQSGLGEVVKSAVIGDEALLALLEEHAAELRARDGELETAIVERCVRVKARVVETDEREAGERRVLNLGHTFAHAIEHAAGYGRVPHGVAVAVGLVLAVEAAARVSVLEDRRLGARLERLLGLLGLPTSLSQLRASRGLALEPERLVAALRSDKKAASGVPLFVLPLRVGAVQSGFALEPALLDELLR